MEDNFGSNYRILEEITSLHSEIQKGCYSKVESLLKDNHNVDEEAENGITPIYMAVKKGSKKICALLLKFRANTNIADLNGVSPLHLAVATKNCGIAKLLIENHADVNLKDKDNTTPISIAVKNGHRKIFNLLFRSGADIDISDSGGRSLLHHAVSGNHYQLAEQLLKNNYALVNRRTVHDITPLYIATKIGKTKLCELLLRFSADPNLSDAFGTSPLHLTAQGNHYKIAELLLGNYAKVNAETMLGATPIYFAAKYANRKMCQLLLIYGADPNSEDSDGTSPLHHSVERRMYKTTELLLQSKANVNQLTNDGITPLLIAVGHGHKPICELLLRAGADPNVPDTNGDTALHVAMWGNEEETITHFHQKLVNILSYFRPFNCRDTFCYPRWKDVKIVSLLLEWGSNPNCLNKHGCSPLQAGVLRKNIELVRLLLLYDANPEYKTPENRKSTLAYCWEWNEMAFFKILLKCCTHIDTYFSTSPTSNEWCYVVAKHLIKLRATGKFMQEDCLELLLDDDLERFQEECKVEIAAMKQERISNLVAFSTFDILTKTPAEIVEYLRKVNSETLLNAKSFTRKYPIYKGLIKWNLKKARRRKKEIDALEIILYNIAFPMPKRQVDSIISDITDEEMRRLVSLSKVKTGPLLLKLFGS